jgi:hypothetical protein
MYVVLKDQFSEQRFSGGRTHKCVMFVFANIDANDHVLVRSGNLFNNLTILFTPDRLFLAHNDLLLV